MIYIGIDPGLSGGIAMLGSDGTALVAMSMPQTEADLLVGLRQAFVDGAVEGERLRACFACVERVGPSPQMGVTSAFTFGKGYGALLMALTAAKIPFDQIVPRKWQAALSCLSGGDKNITKRRAQHLFPTLTVTHAIADALLIAEYCRRSHRGTHVQEEGGSAQATAEAQGRKADPESRSPRAEAAIRQSRGRQHQAQTSGTATARRRRK